MEPQSQQFKNVRVFKVDKDFPKESSLGGVTYGSVKPTDGGYEAFVSRTADRARGALGLGLGSQERLTRGEAFQSAYNEASREAADFANPQRTKSVMKSLETNYGFKPGKREVKKINTNPVKDKK